MDDDISLEGKRAADELVFHQIRDAETGELIKSTSATGLPVPREGETIYLGEMAITEEGLDPESLNIEGEIGYTVEQVDYDYLDADVSTPDVESKAVVMQVNILVSEKE